MDGRTQARLGREGWRKYFADILISGDSGEVHAAADAAAAAEASGAGQPAAKSAGKAAAKRFRDGRGSTRGTAPTPPVAPVDTPACDGWSRELAARLFAAPARWGWQAARIPSTPTSPTGPSAPPPRPTWVEPPHPDTSALRDTRAAAVTRVIWRAALVAVACVAFTTYQLVIEQHVDQVGARHVYRTALLAVAALLGLWVLRALGGVWYAIRNLRNFERPYLAMRDMERQRHDAAVSQWEATVRQHQADAAEAQRSAARRANGPLWFPVYPAAEPTRVDVLGGDPRRNGWASLLTTLGSSELSRGGRVTLLDFTGQDVGGGLVCVAQAAGRRTRSIVLGGRAAPFSLFAGQPRHEIAECLGPALTGGRDGDRREERTLVTDVLRTVIESLDGPLTFPRLAAAVRVLRQGTSDDELSDLEMSRLAGRIGDIDQNEWTTRLLRLTASQLTQLHDVIPVAAGGQWLWTEDSVSVLATDGRRDDREELVQRLLVQLAPRALADRGPLTGCLVVAGADRLGAATLGDLSDHARRTGVRLVLMIDQPQGDLEKTTGTGGAVCVMKMYNHRDAAVAAEFIGKGYKFVLNQVTRQVGTSFTDGGGDSFGANTGNSSSRKQRASGTPGRRQSLSDSRGHTWTGTRNWSSADNLSTSTSSSRCYEFTVEPGEILGMPETAFILIDNAGSGRRVIMADGNPGICLLDRVSAVPAP